MAGSSPAAGMSPSLTASQSIASSAKSGVDSQGSSYSLTSGQTGSFSVGGAAQMNNQLLIIGGLALLALWILGKK
jgi:hypothetical protein